MYLFLGQIDELSNRMQSAKNNYEQASTIFFEENDDFYFKNLELEDLNNAQRNLL